MSFGSIVFTNKGRILQAKAETGVQLNFTKISIGKGYLNETPISTLTDLMDKVMDIPISILNHTNDYAKIGGVLNNSELDTGFYWRELGLFADDPDEGEILYCYGNAGDVAEYIPAGEGSEILEKYINIVAIVGNAANVSATLGSSVYATMADLQNKVDKVDGKGLSSNDFTNEEKEKLAGIEEGATNYQHPATHPASIIVQDANHRFVTDDEKEMWNNKVDKIEGKGLSSNDFTDEDKDKLDSLEFEVQDLSTEIVDNKTQIENLQYNQYQMQLAQYYDGKEYSKKAMFFDGFINTSMMDTANSNVVLNDGKISLYLNSEFSMATGITTFSDMGLFHHSDRLKIAQIIYLTENITLDKIKVNLSREGSRNTDLRCKIYSATNSLVGNYITIASNTISVNDLTTSRKSYYFNFNNYQLNAGFYAIVFDVSASDDEWSYDNYINIQKVSSTPYRCLYYDGDDWYLRSTSDNLYLELIGKTVWDSNYNKFDGKYQTIEQEYNQNLSNAIMYIKYKPVSGCYITPKIAIYNNGNNVNFENLTLTETINLENNYVEARYDYSSVNAGNKIKAQIELNRDNEEKDFSVEEYGCILY